MKKQNEELVPRCLVCMCGHDGKLTSKDCPIHGERSATTIKLMPRCHVKLATGIYLVTPAYPSPCDYVQILDERGKELGYWHHNEWEEDPKIVMGAIIGLLKEQELKVSAALPGVRKKRLGKIVGWDLFDHDGSGVLELLKDDEADKFQDDDDAWEDFVNRLTYLKEDSAIAAAAKLLMNWRPIMEEVMRDPQLVDDLRNAGKIK